MNFKKILLILLCSALSHAQDVGSLPGDVAVTNTGQINYTIPIDASPGTGGMQPDLSLTYDSAAGNGPVGIGWSIGGVSSVSRVPLTWLDDHDGDTTNGNVVPDPVDFDENDQFSLDGQRLIHVAGVHQANAAEYRTELDSFTRVIAFSEEGTEGVAWFRAYTKAGLIYEYGRDENDQDSRIYANSKINVKRVSNGTLQHERLENRVKTAHVLSWNVSRVLDSNGNYIEFFYDKDDLKGTARLAKVAYTGNVNTDLLPYNEVRFIYEDRPDAAASYIAGSLVSQDQRLKTVVSFVEGQEAWRYEIGYKENTVAGRSMLRSVQKLAGNQFLQPTIFEWDEGEEGFANPVLWAREAIDSYHHPTWSNNIDTYAAFIDMNGDGLVDRVYGKDDPSRGATTADDYGLYVALNNGSGFEPQERWYRQEPVTSRARLQNLIAYSHDGQSTHSMLIDLNGDGLPDKVDDFNYDLGSGNENAGIWVSLNRGKIGEDGSAFEPKERWYYDPDHIWNNWPRNASGLGSSVYTDLIDLNADGLPDRVTLFDQPSSNYGIYVALNTGNGFQPKELWFDSTRLDENYITWTGNNLLVYSTFEDVNADGIPDRVDHYNYDINTDAYGPWVSLGKGRVINGSAFEEKQRWLIPYSSDLRQSYPIWRSNGDFYSIFQDVNGDQLPDRLDHHNYAPDINQGGLWVSLNMGNGFDEPKLWRAYADGHQNNPIWNNQENSAFVDINADGLADRAHHYNKVKEANGHWVEINDGNGLLPMVNWIDSVGNHGQNRPSWNATSGQYSAYVDVNGDGFVDRVDHHDYTKSQGGIYVRLNKGKQPRITKVTNGFGVKTEIEFRPLTDRSDPSFYTKGDSSQYPFVDVAGPMLVVASVGRDDGTGGMYETRYRYAGGVSHVNGRGFLGFQSFMSYDTRTDICRIEETYLEFPFTGLSKRAASYFCPDLADASQDILLSETENTRGVKYLNGGKTVFPYITRSQENAYELPTDDAGQAIVNQHEQYLSTTTENEFDAYGNNIKVTMTYADGSQSVTTNTYSSDTSKWFLGRLTRASVTHSVPAQKSVTKVTGYSYDADSGVLESETVEPGDSELAVTTRYEHDSYGNVIKTVIEPANMQPRISSVRSNPDDKFRFYKTESNALGHQSTEEIDPVYGSVLSKVSANERTTKWTYDAWGRVLTETRPDKTVTKTTRGWVAGGQIIGQPALYFTRVENTASPSATKYFDSLNREVVKETQGYDGRSIYTKNEFNNLGQTVRACEPLFEGATAQYWTQTFYDVLGRVNYLQAPDGTKEKRRYHGLTSKIIQNWGGSGVAGNQTTTEIKNAKGQVVRIEDNDGNELSHKYDATGNVILTTDSLGNETKYFYNIRGHKTKMIDPDMGAWEYRHDALGQLVWQKDAKGQVTTIDYDILGRRISRTVGLGTADAQTSRWYYDGNESHDELGAIRLEVGGDGSRKAYYYDDLGRPFMVLQRVADKAFYSTTEYDELSRVKSTHHYWRPHAISGPRFQSSDIWVSFGTHNFYNARSFVTKVDDHSGLTWWSNPVYDQYGALTSYQLGNSVLSEMEYEPDTRLVENIRHKASAGNLDKELAYEFDALGNIKLRKDVGAGLQENFTYDKLNRLTNTRIGATSVSVDYDSIGNIVNKSNLGTYRYGQNGAGPHAVTSVGGVNYSYDANGNMIQRDGSQITWTAFNKPKSINRGQNSSRFTYDSDFKRITHTKIKDGENYQRRLYVGAIEQDELWKINAETQEKEWITSKTKVYVTAPSGSVGVYVHDDGAPPVRQFFHADHLGSIVAISDEIGNLVEEFSYDAWGARRDAQTWQNLSEGQIASLNAGVTDRGFTGHEMLDLLGLVHMNGRIYDQNLGRFLSADPFVQSPGSLQSYNRYSYVLNNPLGYSDPSGYFFKKLFKKIARFVKKNFTTIVVAAIAIATGIYVAGLFKGAALKAAIFGGAAAGGVRGALGTLASGGSFGSALRSGIRGAAIGAAMGAVSYGIGSAFGHSPDTFEWKVELARASAHGVVQGGYAEATGGDFRSGFLGGFAGSLGSHGLSASQSVRKILGSPGDSTRIVHRTVAAGVVGGTAATLGGGKFANGAFSGAFQHLFNAEGATLVKKLKSEQSRSANDYEQKMAAGVKDGHLTTEEAGFHYRNGAGKAVQVDVSKLDFSGVDRSKFVYDERLEAWIQNYHFGLNTDDGRVHGNMTLKRVSESGSFKVYDGRYDFEMHSYEGGFVARSKTFFRNQATKVGEMNASRSKGGTPYWIEYQGEVP